jgi:ParB family chromosome partitioning protein
MESLAAKVVAEGMSVRATEEAVALWDGSLNSSKKARATSPKVEHPRAATIAAALSERYDTRVLVTIAKRGKIVIEFAGEEDLDRILDVLL